MSDSKCPTGSQSKIYVTIVWVLKFYLFIVLLKFLDRVLLCRSLCPQSHNSFASISYILATRLAYLFLNCLILVRDSNMALPC